MQAKPDRRTTKLPLKSKFGDNILLFYLLFGYKGSIYEAIKKCLPINQNLFVRKDLKKSKILLQLF